MNRKIVLPLLAVVFALASAFVSNANEPLQTYYGVNTAPNPDQCIAGTLDPVGQNCDTPQKTVQCTVRIMVDGDPEIVEAFNSNSNPTTCAAPLWRQ